MGPPLPVGLDLQLPMPLTASAALRPCEFRAYHVPEPIVTQGHHRFPEYLQRRKYGRVALPELRWACGTDHDSVHAWIYWRMGERACPPDPGRLIKAEVELVLDWWHAAA